MNAIKNFFKRLWHRILNPSIVQAAIAVVIGSIFIAVAVVLSMGGINDIGALICYAFSLVAIVYIGYICFYGYPRVKQRTLEFAARHDFTDNLVKNYGYRTMAFACGSAVLNALYAVYNGAVALHYSSLWSGLFAVYYGLLCVLRTAVLTGKRRGKNRGLTPQDRRRRSIDTYMRCGMALVAFTLIIVAAIVRLAVADGGARHSGYLIFVSALYTFIRFGLAVYNIRKAKKFDDFDTKTLRNLSFADALVALFTLQMSLSSTFGGERDYVRIFGTVTGSAVCAVIVLMGIHMIVAGAKAGKSNAGE